MKSIQTVVITGASAGVGRATAHAFARAGANVALLARQNAALDAAAEEVRALGGRALAVAVDVSDAEQVEVAATRIEQELGPIDVWVNAAMATIFAPVHEIRPEEFRRVTEVTYLGVVYSTLAALKRMRQRNHGAIVQVGSALAYRAIPLQAAYCGAKFAIRGFTDALRVELMHEHSRIHVTMVQLSAFNTPQFDWARTRLSKRPQPLPPIYQPEVAARAVVWAARHRRRELYVGFPAVKAIIGNKLAPWFADRVLARSAFKGQLGERDLPADRPDNLDAAVQADYGTRGRFNQHVRGCSLQLWVTTHRGLTAAVAGAVGLALACTVARRRCRNRHCR